VTKLERLAGEAVDLATRAGLRIAVAESLTGGMLAAAIVSVPGASAVFSGGVVAYDTAVKGTLLGVDAELLRERGPVDQRVAEQMAFGVRRACAVPSDEGSLAPAHLGVSTTGVAGPSADPQTGQPPGTVWIGASSAEGEESELHRFEGRREEIRRRSVVAALRVLIRRIEQV